MLKVIEFTAVDLFGKRYRIGGYRKQNQVIDARGCSTELTGDILYYDGHGRQVSKTEPGIYEIHTHAEVIRVVEESRTEGIDSGGSTTLSQLLE